MGHPGVCAGAKVGKATTKVGLLAVFVGELLFYLRGGGLLWAEDDLQADVGDPAGLAVVGGDGLKAAAAHHH